MNGTISSMATIKLPHLNSYIDVRGKLRHQCRPPGYKTKTIKGKPGTEEFMIRYHDWLAKGGVQHADIGASRTRGGTLNAAIVAYFKDKDHFMDGLSKASQDMRRPILNGLRETVAPN